MKQIGEFCRMPIFVDPTMPGDEMQAITPRRDPVTGRTEILSRVRVVNIGRTGKPQPKR